MTKKEHFFILAIESSCDETAAAVTDKTTVLSNVISSQIEIHKRFGGVVPEIASRNHTLQIKNVVEQAVADAGLEFSQLDAVAVTYGAGLLGALLVGVSYAKALAYALGIPLVAVNHITGHIAANHIGRELEPPYICLVASGGHTAVAKITALPGSSGAVEIIGQTQDDAAGEAFDKVARTLGLCYPGGPEIEKLAKLGSPTVELPYPLKGQAGYDFSYSGLKTAVINQFNRKNQKGEVDDKFRADVAASFQEVATDMMVNNTVRAAKDFGIKTIVLAGGVAANTRLREKMQAQAKKYGFELIYPPLSLCTDNAAMIAVAAYFKLLSGGEKSGLGLDADASVRITD